MQNLESAKQNGWLQNIACSPLYLLPWMYDKLCGDHLMPGRIAAIEALPAEGELDVLEVGIGTGLTLPHYRAGINLVGIDRVEKMLDKARERIRMSCARVTLLPMNGELLIFPESTFHAAVLPYVLPAVPDARRVLEEVHRVLHPGGYAIIVNAFHQRNRMLQLLSSIVPKQVMTQLIGFHAELKPEEITEAPGWIVLRNEEVKKSRLFVLQKV